MQLYIKELSERYTLQKESTHNQRTDILAAAVSVNEKKNTSCNCAKFPVLAAGGHGYHWCT
jgi:hypothetical protein